MPNLLSKENAFLVIFRHLSEAIPSTAIVVTAGKHAGANYSSTEGVILPFPSTAASLDTKKKGEMFLEEYPLHPCQQAPRVTQGLDATKQRASCSLAAPVCQTN